MQVAGVAEGERREDTFAAEGTHQKREGVEVEIRGDWVDEEISIIYREHREAE